MPKSRKRDVSDTVRVSNSAGTRTNTATAAIATTLRTTSRTFTEPFSAAGTAPWVARR